MTKNLSSVFRSRRVVGLLPAAGRATRLGRLPCSKEILPTGHWDEEAGELAGQIKVACHHVLERMRRGGVKQVHIVIRDGKWDVPAFLGNGRSLDMELAYHVVDVPWGPAFSLDAAYPFVRDDLVVTGFPDHVLKPEDAVERVLARREETGADVVLGLFPTDRTSASDMVAFDDDGRVDGIEIKPDKTDLQYMWAIAAWTPRFTEFMHGSLAAARLKYGRGREASARLPEAHVGMVLRGALREEPGLILQSIAFDEGACEDLGVMAQTPTEVRAHG
jgi:glucose-1-phosphate thymidylyltransferase